MKAKKILSAVLAVLSISTSFITANAKELSIGYWNIAYPYRYVMFATDGGSYIKALERNTGEYVNLAGYVPIKEGYIFGGWYSDPRTKVDRVYDVTLTENIVVYAKWIDDGTPKPQAEEHIGLTVEEALAYGDYVDEKTGAPVTRLWVQQNAKLQELMQEYNAKFNK